MEGVTLCLYCDKAFKVSDIILREEHVNSEHFYFVEGRRTSSRTEKKVVEIENPKYPGCFYCNSGKKCIKVNDLNLLYSHLSQKHHNEYFACKKCKLRFTDIHSFRNHQKICKFCKRSIRKDGKRIIKKIDKSLGSQRNNQSVDVNDGIAEKCDSLKEKIESNMTLPNKNAILKKSENRSKSKTRKKTDKSADSMQPSPESTNGEEYNILTRHKKSITMNEPTLFRLGVTQNRSPTRQCSKNKQSTISDTKASPPATKVLRTKSTKVSIPIAINLEAVDIPKQPEVNTDFDEDFYKTISSHIKNNLNSFVDGKMANIPKSILEEIASMSVTENERVIYQATDFETIMPFPALLTQEQYGSEESNQNKIKRHITKNSWKWKWDLIKKYKYVNEGGKIVKKVKEITSGQRDLSKLDMWTQLSMRKRHENISLENIPQSSMSISDEMSYRIIKSKNLEQLNEILDKRQMPNIVHEQNDQTVVKLELVDQNNSLICDVPPAEPPEEPDILKMFNLRRRHDTFTLNANLSGEWARPRCYICSDCGQKFDLIKSLEDHKNAEHPYVVSSHYEIVGRENLEKKFYKNLFFTKKAFLTHNNAYRDSSQTPVPTSSDVNEVSSDASVKLQDMSERECTKCRKNIRFANDVDLYRHILDCVGDTVWMQAKRRMKYRRSQRRRRVSNKGSASKKSKNTPVKEEGDRPVRPRPEVSKDLPSFTEIEEDKIQRMLAELPAKRNDRKSTSPQSQKHPPGKSKRIQKLLRNAKIKASKEPNNIKQFFKVSKKGASGKKSDSSVASDSTNNDHTRKVLRSAKKSVSNAEVDTNNRISAIKLTNTTKNNKISGKRKCSKFMLNKIENTKLEGSEELISNIQLSADLEKKELMEVVDNEPILPANIESQANLPADKFESIDSFTENSIALSQISESVLDADSETPLEDASCQFLKITIPQTAPKKKVKKLNDCIARLTCKIQEKLGVSFFESTCNLLSPTQADDEILDLSIDKSISTQETLEPKLEVADVLIMKKTENLINKSLADKEEDEKPSSNIMEFELKCAIEKNTEAECLAGKSNELLNVNIGETSAENNVTDEDTVPLIELIKKVENTSILKKTNKKVETASLTKENCNIISKDISPEFLKTLELNGKHPKLVDQNDAAILLKKELINMSQAPLPIIKTVKTVEAMVKQIPENIMSQKLKAPEPVLCKKVTFVEDLENVKALPEVILKEPQPSISAPPIIPSAVSEVQSIKVSIPKTKLPKLNEILFQYQTITVNNIKISLPERRAFEEQKSRIMKILKETHHAMAIKENLARKTRKAKKSIEKAKELDKNGMKLADKRIVPKNSEKSSKNVKGKKCVKSKPVEEVAEPFRAIRPRRMSVSEPVYVQKITASVMRPRRMSVADRRLEATAVTITKKVIAGKRSKIFIPKTIDMVDRKNANKKVSLEIMDNVLMPEISNKKPKETKKVEEVKKPEKITEKVQNKMPLKEAKILDAPTTKIKLSVQQSEMISEALDDVPLARINKTFEKNFVVSFLENQRALQVKQELNKEPGNNSMSFDAAIPSAIPRRLNGIRQRRLTIAESHFNTVRYPSNSKKLRTTNNSQQNEFYDGVLKVSDSSADWDPKTFNKTTIDLPKTMNKINHKNKSKKCVDVKVDLKDPLKIPSMLQPHESNKKCKAPSMKAQLVKAPVLKPHSAKAPVLKAQMIQQKVHENDVILKENPKTPVESAESMKFEEVKEKCKNIESSDLVAFTVQPKEYEVTKTLKTKSLIVETPILNSPELKATKHSVKADIPPVILKNVDKKLTEVATEKDIVTQNLKITEVHVAPKTLQLKAISSVSISQLVTEKPIATITTLKALPGKNIKISSPINDLNEDSLFNDDDNEVEFSDIVNNIINSSELIDFDDDDDDLSSINLKNSIKLNDSKVFAPEKTTNKLGTSDTVKKIDVSLSATVDKDQLLSTFWCDICLKNYASNKSLQKHYTTNLHSINKASKEKEATFIQSESSSMNFEVVPENKSKDQVKLPEKLQNNFIETIKEKHMQNLPLKFSDELPETLSGKLPIDIKEKNSPEASLKIQKVIPVEIKPVDPKMSFRSKGALKIFELPPPKITTSSAKGGDGILNDIFDKLCNTATMNNNKIDANRFSNQHALNNKKFAEKVTPTSTSKTKDFEENLKRSKINFTSLLDANRTKASESLFDHIKGLDKIKDQAIPPITINIPKIAVSKSIKNPSILSKVNKIKETTVNLPTKSLIMGKIFKKQNKDKSKVKISSESDCKNDLDRIFDHLKNTDEIDDRILTSSPTISLSSPDKHLEPVNSEPFKMQISNGVSTDEEDACNNNNSDDEVSIGYPKNKKRKAVSIDNNSDLDRSFEPEGKRKSSRKCAIKAKTFAETWSSDEYEEFHNFDVIQLIDEIEKKHLDVAKRSNKKTNKDDAPQKKQIDETSVDLPEISSLNQIETTNGRNQFENINIKPSNHVKKDKKFKLSEVVDVIDSEDESLSSIMMKEVSSQKKALNPLRKTEERSKKENQKKKSYILEAPERIDSEDDSIIITSENISENHKKASNPSKKIKKNKKSQPEMIESEDDSVNISLANELQKVTENKLTKINIENIEPQPAAMTENHLIENSSRKEKLDKKISSNNNNNNHQSTNCNNIKKKLLKSRKKRNRPKNMAYDSDSDFELNLHKKPKSMLNQGNEAEELSDCHKSTAHVSDNETYKSDRKSIDQTSKRHDLSESLMAEVGNDGEAANRTKRISSEKLYYWSSSSSGSDAEQDDDGRSFVEKLDEDKNELPQHGWIVGDSHKKLVKLLAHAKIKKKIN